MVLKSTKESKLKTIEREFLSSLEYLSDPQETKLFATHVFAPLSRAVSNNKNFYNLKGMQEEIYSSMVQELSGATQNPDKAFAIVKKYVTSPLGIFDEILLYEEASDIFVVSDRISVDVLSEPLPIIMEIPEPLQQIYEVLVDILRTLTHYSSSLATTKFDPANPIIDYEVEGLRFNVAHQSLNALRNERPIISVRHQVLKASRKTTLDESYIESLKLSDKQLKTIKDLAYNKSFMVIGQTGSGKSTLLRYMGNYKIKDKRNLITIEDTPELFLPVNITYLTNERKSIQDLFKVALRENPSHVIVGETRSDEIVDILESSLVFNTGTSVHADSFAKLIMRIVFMVKNARPNYVTDDILSLFTTTVDGVILMKDRQVAEVWKRKDEYSLTADTMQNYELVR